MSITVRDLVKHLQTLPQDLDLVTLWDEGGTYHYLKTLPKVIDMVKSNNCLSYGGKEWTDDAGWGGELNPETDEYDEEYKVYERRTVVRLD
jgi:hypothetical protein